ncbi:MAG: hypothetical protein A2Y00_06500 [Omnitrophica WOR_2 bacterium GWF2_43_52]|nr:MAG: hypothetical protein A2Y00_06500 [Omnitrophica WOR_2 bacterium GWF2_43_52]HAH20705.1 radical SAM protein [Candidatus Omnitrophota bacterium]HBG64836.1 radical SAM protein [Candidatus Omnitrophota bacterium]
MKIVVANSIGVDERGYRMIHYPSRWTTGVKRAYFAWYPWELAYTSALLKRETDHAVKMIDGCWERLNFKTYRERLMRETPDMLIMESSSRTIEEDLLLAESVKKELGTKIIMAGQHASAYPEGIASRVDYVCVGEYEFTVLDIVKGIERSKIEGLYPNHRRDPFDINLLPWPEDEDIRRIEYCYPGPPGLKYRQIQAYASRGCPFQCGFCVCSNLYYNKPLWRPRKTDDVVNEIIYLKNKYNEMEGIFFDEEVHNLSKPHTVELCNKISAAGLHKLHYTAMCMYNMIDEEVLERMKEAGYYQVRIGIETASDAVAHESTGKTKMDMAKLYKVLEAAKKLKIDIYGTFLIGALGSDEKEDLKTVELIKGLLKKELICELQISICTPQPGTPFFDYVDKQGFLLTKDWQRFDGMSESVISYPHYPKERIEEVFKKAVDAGHFYRGQLALKREGLLPVLIKAVRKRGVLGSIKLILNQLFH